MLASALALTMLTACENSGDGRITLAHLPGDIRLCFDKLVPAPPAGALSRQQIVQLISDLKRSELAKSQCGKRLIGFYDAQAEAFARR